MYEFFFTFIRMLRVRSVVEAISPGVNGPGLEADNSPPSSAEVRNAW